MSHIRKNYNIKCGEDAEQAELYTLLVVNMLEYCLLASSKTKHMHRLWPRNYAYILIRNMQYILQKISSKLFLHAPKIVNNSTVDGIVAKEIVYAHSGIKPWK